MIASSFLDPLLGIDVHWEFVPMPAPVPTPIPNPFTGIVFDPIGLAAGLVISNAIGVALGGSFKGPVVYWTAFPATNTGTEGKHIPGHILIPPGTGWAPIPRTPRPVIRPNDTPKPPKPITPDNDAVVVFGSKTVHVMGSNAVRLGDIALSCSEPVRLPSTVVLAIPKGAPILVGGPPTLDLAAAILASLRTRFIGDSLQALISRLPIGRRGRAFLSWAACMLTGHPVDVATGKVMTRALDVELPGPLPLRIERFYLSNFASRPGPLGRGWSLSLDQAIWEERGKVVYLAEDGREIEFDTFHLPEHRMGAGDEVRNDIDRLTLRRERGGWLVTSSDGVRRELAPVAGRTDGRAPIRRMASRCGNHDIAFAYDERGRLEAVRDSAGRRIQLENDEDGRVVALALPLPDGGGSHVHRRYEYDDEGDLVRVVDANGNAWSFEYVTHLLVRETDRTGLSFFFDYDGLGEDAWCTRTWGDGGIYDHVLKYDKKNHVTYVTDSLGHTTQYHMNAAGLVVKRVEPTGGATRYEYDPVSLQCTGEVDPLGNATRSTYDARGNLVQVDEPDGAITRFVYNERFDVPVLATDPNGHQWRWEYDSLGQLTARWNPLGQATRFEYADGFLRRASTPDGVTAELDYDDQGNVARLGTPGGAEFRFEHDRLGRERAVIGAHGSVERRTYDAEGNLVRVEGAGLVRDLCYDAEGNLLRSRDALRDVTFEYGGFHRLHARHEAGTTIRLRYDTEEQLRAVENEAGERYELELDARGLVVRERGFDGHARRYERDAAGRVVKVTQASGRNSALSYDAMGRITDVAHSDGAFERYRYRADGSLIEASNDSAEIHFERDELGRIVRERTRTKDGIESWVMSRYDAAGRRIWIESSEGVAQQIHRNIAGDVERLELHREVAPWTVSFERDPVGLELARRFPNGITSRWELDALGRPVRRTVARDGYGIFDDQRYEWGGEDRLREIVDRDRGATRYEHDARGRLAGARLPSGEEQHRARDEVGNVYRSPDLSDRRYAPGGRIVEADGSTYTHDADGNLVRRTDAQGRTTEYRWNGAGMLREVALPDGRHVRFAYDALARRVKKEVWQGAADEAAELLREVRWSWDRRNPLVEVDSAEGKSAWVFEPETFQPLLKSARGMTWGVLTDHLGTPTELVADDGGVSWRMRPAVIGQPFIEGEETECPFRWPGQMADAETGLWYNHWRYYMPELGCYSAVDPLGLEGGLSLFGYTSDPLMYCDPLGLIERFFRFTSEAEARQSAGNLGGDNNLHPRPHGQTTSRGPKWITEQGAPPRLGDSRPDWRLDIEAEDGTREWLRRNGIDFDHVPGGEASVPDRVLRKANEPGSHGVGRNLLEQFNARVRRIQGSKVGGNQRNNRRRGGCGTR